LEVYDAKTDNLIITLEGISGSETIKAIKKRIAQKKLKLTEERQALRVEPKGKPLGDAVLYVRDLGPQIAWKTVFMAEYAGPLFVYPLFYLRPTFIYG
nr:SC2 protein - Caenorhabditis briggsae (fragments) [Caenorhabditis briggsae]